MSVLYFGGDVVLQNEYSKSPLLSSDLKQRVGDSFFCVNYEGPVKKEGAKAILKKGPSLSQSEQGIRRIVSSGIKYFNLCNNHIMDYGSDSALYTKTSIEANGGYCIGLSEYDELPVFFRDIDDIRVCVISVGENGFGCNELNPDTEEYGYYWMLKDDLVSRICELRSKSDFIIVNCHAGMEEVDCPLPEYRMLYRKYIDAGADCVVGHHPHVIQGGEQYKGGYIYYSLGNLAFDSLENPDRPYNPYGIIAEINIDAPHMASYSVLGSKYENGIVHIEQKSVDIFVSCAQRLMSTKYIEYINEKCVSAYENIYRGYYKAICRNEKIYKKIKHKIYAIMHNKKYEGNKGFDDVFLCHNLCIDTHRWVVERAVTLLYKKLSKEC